MMKYFKDPKSGDVYAYEADGSQDEWIKDGLLAMTDAEVTEHLRQSSPGLSREEVHAQRLIAYADPVTGSDRYMTEALAERVLGNEDSAKVAEQKCITRREEISEQYPWPAE